ncbi:hypothetical protein IW140_002137 [Coemansia sp. RSA 1813]|nr:hypothetical protein EV178_001285 [Coemansia sp. RSA 1646]KAJ1772636.1 hypothetical protein LPJ74_001352 [Coemansia sp. RSA 1843]KAJ2090222.1 hypothetical protein IW138_002854 [Coemansia sp. RSA 986]KAJ2214628.1 hypothetical protein EV179_002887 [Coemansia sp. RSA 487]KAJ2570711.1 hypothetical protein IW140_002137 [Coemansia sp. RSA 1813]
MFDGHYLRMLLDLEVPVWQIAVLAGVTLLAASNITAKLEEPAEEIKSSDSKDDDNIARQALNEGTKLVLVVRSDLALPKGTVAQLCAQATLECFKQARQLAPRVLREWEHTGQAKVTLKCSNRDELCSLQQKAEASGLVACSANNANANDEPAVLGIGPGPIGLVNTVSGDLKLY